MAQMKAATLVVMAVLLVAAVASSADAAAKAKLPTVVVPQVAKPAGVKKAEEKVAAVKVVVQNKASKSLGVKVQELEAKDKEVVCKEDKWTGLGTFQVGAKQSRVQVLHLTVAVHNDKGVVVKKALVLDLLKRFKGQLEGKKFVVLKAVEERKKTLLGKVQKCLNVWLDDKIVLTIIL